MSYNYGRTMMMLKGTVIWQQNFAQTYTKSMLLRLLGQHGTPTKHLHHLPKLKFVTTRCST